MGELLTLEQRQGLLDRHRGERDRRVADRIKAVLLRDDGWSYERIAEALFLSDEAIRKHIADFIGTAKLKPENGGSAARLDAKQTRELLAHMHEKIYVDVKDICDYVWVKFGALYSRSGMTQWLHRNGFSYHKPAAAPAKADKAKQEAFLVHYENLKKTLPDGEKIVFMDGVHPTHQTRLAYGWIRKGHRKELPTTSAQKRMNILGALGLEDMSLFSQEFDTIDHEAVILFLKNLQIKMPNATAIHVILDSARYHTCPEVMDYVKTSRIRLHHLPPYSPNLNVIERCWKILHEHVTNNRYYPTFNAFADAILAFLTKTFPQNARLWVDRLSDNFTPIQSPLPTTLQV
jgi:transposase